MERSDGRMWYYVGQLVVGGPIHWQFMGDRVSIENGVIISFPFFGATSERQAARTVQAALNESGVDWLAYSGGRWRLNASAFRAFFSGYSPPDWLQGEIEPEVDFNAGTRTSLWDSGENVIYAFVVTAEMAMAQAPKRIFLSHKGIDKPQDRSYHRALEAVGFSPWLDEAELAAGAALERELLQGFEDSCAAVFFITPDFKDENYLASEVNYAIQQKRKKKNRFSIITLQINGGKIPALLETFVYKAVSTEIEGFTEIVRALPICPGAPIWRSD